MKLLLKKNFFQASTAEPQNTTKKSELFSKHPIIPIMLGVAAFHFLADFKPCPCPEIFQVVRDLKGAACRRKKFQKDGNAQNLWGLKAAENLLNYDFKGRLYASVRFFFIDNFSLTTVSQSDLQGNFFINFASIKMPIKSVINILSVDFL